MSALCTIDNYITYIMCTYTEGRECDFESLYSNDGLHGRTTCYNKQFSGKKFEFTV